MRKRRKPLVDGRRGASHSGVHLWFSRLKRRCAFLARAAVAWRGTKVRNLIFFLPGSCLRIHRGWDWAGPLAATCDCEAAPQPVSLRGCCRRYWHAWMRRSSADRWLHPTSWRRPVAVLAMRPSSSA
eukprot:scaffold1277_cov253-Pinguiococcus_pyrenoidosus.AAC.6